MVEEWLAGPVESVTPVRGGFTPTVAARVRCGDRSLFVKVCEAAAVDRAAGFFRNEIRIAGALPDIPQLAPLRRSFDDGDWIALGFDDLGGAPPALPWSDPDLEAVLGVLAAAHRALTPSPLPEPPAEQGFAQTFTGWRSLTGDEPGLDPCSRRHLPALQAVEAVWPRDVSGTTLIHGDLRADNVVFSPGRGAVIVDWPAACVGPAWLDLVCFAPSVEAEGGPRCAELLERWCAVSPTPPSGALAFTVVGVAGYFTANALLPAPPGLPTVRRFQARQGVPARRWAAQLLDLC